jgi:DNA-binding CsgD family transcriptional regulator
MARRPVRRSIGGLLARSAAGWSPASAPVPSGPGANIRSMSEIGDKVLKLHGLGVRSIDIAHRLNVAQSTVHYHLRKRSEQELVQKGRGDEKRPMQRAPMAAHSIVRTQQRVAQLLERGISRIEIARQLGIAKSTVSYHARRLGKPIDERCRRRYDWGIVQSFYDEGHSVRDCCRAFGFSSGTWHSAVQRGLVNPRPGFRPVEEIFAPNTRRNRGHLKQRLLRLGLKDGACERCGLTEWLGGPISMALHHINGERLDNRVENLELLCPNCHSQTETYSGRNGRYLKPTPNPSIDPPARPLGRRPRRGR